jgi:hypothetical protein
VTAPIPPVGPRAAEPQPVAPPTRVVPLARRDRRRDGDARDDRDDRRREARGAAARPGAPGDGHVDVLA